MRTFPQPAVTGRPPGLAGAALVGVGMAVPEQVVTNAAIADRLGVDEEWISRRTGTSERHVAAPGQRLDEFAATAARAAPAQGGGAGRGGGGPPPPPRAGRPAPPPRRRRRRPPPPPGGPRPTSARPAPRRS